MRPHHIFGKSDKDLDLMDFAGFSDGENKAFHTEFARTEEKLRDIYSHAPECVKRDECMVELNIVLLEPEIPQNTGNVGRILQCHGVIVAPDRALRIYSIEDKYLKRAGLDYWKDLNVQVIQRLWTVPCPESPGPESVFFQKNRGAVRPLTIQIRSI